MGIRSVQLVWEKTHCVLGEVRRKSKLISQQYVRDKLHGKKGIFCRGSPLKAIIYQYSSLKYIYDTRFE